MAGDIKGKYGSSGQTITCTFGNNPTGTISQHGRLSAAIDNSSNGFAEVLIQGKIKTGGSTPSGNKQFIIYGLGSADGGTTYTDGLAAGDADSSALPPSAKPIINLPVAVASTTFVFGPIAVSPAFGGAMPAFWMIDVFNDNGVTPSTTNADHSFWYQGSFSQYT
jgi:hypothetical protein